MLKEKMKEFLIETGIIIPKEPIKEFYSQLLKLSGLGASVLLNYSGKKAGSIVARYVREMLGKENPSLGEILLTINTFLLESSICSCIDFEIKDENLTLIRIKGSIFADGIENKRPVCMPLAGAFSGVLESISGIPWECKELECQAQGKEFCLFELKAK